MLPQRRHENSGRAKASRECAPHRKWVRGFACSACGYKPVDRDDPIQIEAAHYRIGTNGGTGLKPSDKWCISLCNRCHNRQHNEGELTFWRRIGIADPVALALEFARKSPRRAELRDMP